MMPCRAFKQLDNLAAEMKSQKPVYLDISVEKSDSDVTSKKVQEVVVTNETTEKHDCRRAVLLALLFVSCLASWLLFFVQVNKLLKRFHKRQQKKVKKAAKKKNELRVPLLSHEGTMK